MNRISTFLLMLLLVMPVSARAEFPLERDAHNPFKGSEQRRFLPAKEAFQASAWRDDERVYVGFVNAKSYYLHRHQFALDSRFPNVSFGELELPPGERMMHDALGEIYVFYNKVVFNAPIEARIATNEPLSIMVTFQGCTDQGLCYPPERVELEALHGSPPVAFATTPPETLERQNGAY